MEGNLDRQEEAEILEGAESLALYRNSSARLNGKEKYGSNSRGPEKPGGGAKPAGQTYQ